MKKCGKCKKDKELTEFYPARKKPGGYQSMCKLCNRRYVRKRYRKNKEQNYTRNKSIRDNLHSLILEVLANHTCVDCGESDPVVLDFDHVRGEKLDAVSVMVNKRCAWATIKEEIAKCDVRCANCHRRKTAKDFKWKRLTG